MKEPKLISLDEALTIVGPFIENIIESNSGVPIYKNWDSESSMPSELRGKIKPERIQFCVSKKKFKVHRYSFGKCPAGIAFMIEEINPNLLLYNFVIWELFSQKNKWRKIEFEQVLQKWWKDNINNKIEGVSVGNF